METGHLLSDGTHTAEEKDKQTNEHMVKINRGRGEGNKDDLDPDGDRRHALSRNPQGKRRPGKPKNTW
jgi:hypothetical protein